jgi:hypothetical protein
VTVEVDHAGRRVHVQGTLVRQRGAEHVARADHDGGDGLADGRRAVLA